MAVSSVEFWDKGFGEATEIRHRISHLPHAADATGTFAIVLRDAHKTTMSDEVEWVKEKVEPSGIEPEFVSLPPYRCGR